VTWNFEEQNLKTYDYTLFEALSYTLFEGFHFNTRAACLYFKKKCKDLIISMAPDPAGYGQIWPFLQRILFFGLLPTFAKRYLRNLHPLNVFAQF
jgi:hypothetical protein